MALALSTLPNGLRVRHVSRQDLVFLYEEVMQQNSYLQHGVELRQGDVVLDIGMFLDWQLQFLDWQLQSSWHVALLLACSQLRGRHRIQSPV